MMTSKRRVIRQYLLSATCVLFSFFASALAQTESTNQDYPPYYLQLQNEEFFHALIPKERYLLGIMESVNYEMWERNAEGFDISTLGMDELISPQEQMTDEYLEEYEKIRDLLIEIEELERLARRRVNLDVLQMLSQLKDRIQDLFIRDQSLPSVPESSDSTDVALLDISVQETYEETNVDRDSGEPASIEDGTVMRDLIEQWKYNRLLDYKLKLTEYELLRSRLLKTGTTTQQRRMFQRYLRVSLENYSAGNMALARLQLRDILETFSDYETLDDVLYYASESAYGLNFFDEAILGYGRLVEAYPQSSYSAKALEKIIYIHYTYGEFDKLFDVYQQLLVHQEQLDSESFGAVSYLVGYAHFKSGSYLKSLTCLGNVKAETTYFFPSLYLSAACYSNLGQDDLAISIYQRLSEEKNKGLKNQLLAQIKNNALLKLGLMYYERGENQRAIAYFDRISTDFQHYDLSVIGKAWSAYRSGMPGEALRNVEWLLQHSLVSNYIYEARVLAASSKDLLGYSEEAVADLKAVFQVGRRADQVAEYTPERLALIEGIQEVESIQESILAEREREILSEVSLIRRFLEGSSTSGAYRTEADGGEISETAETLAEKIDALDRMEVEARAADDSPMLNEIRELRSDLIQTLEDHAEYPKADWSNSEEDPLIRRMGMSEYLKYIFQTLLMQTLREKQQTRRDIEESDVLIAEANEQDRFELTIQLEIRKQELNDYYGRLNQYEVWLRENQPQSYDIDLGQWAAFSGYGISNINFTRIQECDYRIAEISSTIDALDRVFTEKKRKLDMRIRGLLSDVAKIEEQMQYESEKRAIQEQERFFKGEYFDRKGQESMIRRLQEQVKKKENKKEKE